MNKITIGCVKKHHVLLTQLKLWPEIQIKIQKKPFNSQGDTQKPTLQPRKNIFKHLIQ